MVSCSPSVPHSKALVGSDSDLQSKSFCLSKFKLYETKASFYLIGINKTRNYWKIIKIQRSEPSELDIFEDPTIYNRQDCNDVLNRLHTGNLSTGGLKFVTKVYGIIGFVKFLEPYYMILVTKRQLVGNICGHLIYGIGQSRLISIPHLSVQTNVATSPAEQRYKKLFNAIDLTKDFFFSYTYRIMWSLQRNVMVGKTEKTPYESMFVWNSFLTSGFRQQVSSLQWTVALIYGYFKQTRLSVYGTTTYKVTLVARRSRHFAGTRYLKRGVNEKGRVANDVETEQLIHAEPWGELGQVSSVVQHRGSIPLFWSQETSILTPKPDIKIQKHESGYKATRLHFENLVARYGNPIIVLNLVKTTEKRPRETILCREFAKAVAHLNTTLPEEEHIKFIQWDFHKFAKSAPTNVLDSLGQIATDALNQVGFYYSSKPNHVRSGKENLLERTARKQRNQNDMEVKGQKPHKEQGEKKFQHGILRSNCIDCLDRTNVAQYAFGLAALGQQTHALGLCDVAYVAVDSSGGSALMGMYADMGDVLALQYGGSTAHNTVFSNTQGKWKAAAQSLDLLRSIRRHYSNAYTDGQKQDAINIFLGHFQPELGKPPLWQLDSDNHLQIRRAGYNPLIDAKTPFKRSFSAGSMLDQYSAGPLSPGLDFRLKHPSLNAIPINNFGDMTTDLDGGSFALISPTSEVSMPDGNFESISDVRHGVADQYTDNDSVSSSGNSCEEDLYERHIFSTENQDFFNGTMHLPDTIEESETDQPCAQEYEDSLAETWKRDAMGASTHSITSQLSDLHFNAEQLDEPHNVVSIPASTREEDAPTLKYSESFYSWVDGDHTFFKVRYI